MAENAEVKKLAEIIKDPSTRNIILMLGAGVSTAAGIPDFRSPKTGLYANLARLNLPYPEAVFDIQFFNNNPAPFYTLANELYPGKFRPTLTHSFIRLLHEQHKLKLCLTQNIDTLERRAGVPDYKIIEAHGSFATQRCLKCHTPFDDAKMKEIVMNFSKDKKIPRCEKKGCNGLVKPDIVFFGEGMPPEFFKSWTVVQSSDLIIVIGTSLTVHPFATLAEFPPPRALINLDLVGDFGDRDDDIILLGKCDEIVRELCKELGWEEELIKFWEETKSSVETDSEAKGDGEAEKKSLEADDEAGKLAERLGKQLVLDKVAESIGKKQDLKDGTEDEPSTSTSAEDAEPGFGHEELKNDEKNEKGQSTDKQEDDESKSPKL